MAHARSQHPNARLTPRHRLNMVACVLDKGWSVEATADRFQVDAKTVRKWCGRFAAEGLARLDPGDRATDREPVRRYQRDRPGELVHVDVKKLSAIPPGGGWKTHGRGNAPAGAHARVGYRFLHTALDNRTRLVYSEILDDEQGATAAGFWRRARAWFELQGVTIERCLTDNGSCYRSRLWAAALAETNVTHKRTRPYRPQTNGKVERFHRILLEEWAYIRPWTSEPERHAAYDGLIHFYDHHRSHGALNWATPHETLTQLAGDNLPADHSQMSEQRTWLPLVRLPRRDAEPFELPGDQVKTVISSRWSRAR